MIKGLSVTLSSYLLTRIVNLVTTIGLARFLIPDQMGFIAVCFLLIYIIDIVRDFGLRDAVIYDPKGQRGVQSTASLMLIGLGLVQAAAVFLIAPFIVTDPNSAVLREMVMWLALYFPLNSLAAIHEAVLHRALRFGRVAVAEISGVVVRACITFALLFNDYGPMSMVYGLLAGVFCRTIVYWYQPESWRPEKPVLTLATFSFLLGYGKHIFFTGALYAARTRADQVLISALIGEAALAAYFLASRIPEIVVSGVNTSITRVVFPGFVSSRGSKKALRSLYIRTLNGCMVGLAPLSIGLASISTFVVPLVFGEAYSDASPVLALLALSGIPVAIGWSAGDLFKATGRPQLLTVLAVLEVFCFLPSAWAVAKITGDLVAMAATVLVCECLVSAVRIVMVWKYYEIHPWEMLRATLLPIVYAAVMGAGVLLTQSMLSNHSNFSIVAVSIIVGISIYVALIALFDRKTMLWVLEAAQNK
ncbi:hypothetical protein C1J03_15355 [Sulfitobacter sp. SK012]|nr:hypothetical protein C1J03_15355 [Sulfitobacter sp. SK012]